MSHNPAPNLDDNAVWHVTTLKKLQRSRERGTLSDQGKVFNAWEDHSEACRFSKQTGRRVILRIARHDYDWERKDGHKGKALFTRDIVPYPEAII